MRALTPDPLPTHRSTLTNSWSSVEVPLVGGGTVLLAPAAVSSIAEDGPGRCRAVADGREHHLAVSARVAAALLARTDTPGMVER